MRKKPILSSLVLLGLTAGIGAAGAQEGEIFMIEEDPIAATEIDNATSISIAELERQARISWSQGNKSAAEAAFRKIAEIVRRRATAPHATPETIFLSAGSLNKIAHFYAPANGDFRPEKQMAQILPSGSPSSPLGVSQESFKLAEHYRLQAMALLDRLPANNASRIYGQRALVYFYRYYGKTNEEHVQTQKLSALLNTADQDQLFPFRRPCYGCGRG